MNTIPKLVQTIEHLTKERDEAQARCAEMGIALEKILRTEPAHNEGGGLFYPQFDVEGNEIGETQVDPLTLLQDIYTIANRVLSTDCGKGWVQFEMPPIHPTTASLVLRFAKAMADKLRSSEIKHGYSDGWAIPDGEDWPDPVCYEHLVQHLQKGDPIDVANYCAFLWYHGMNTVHAWEIAATHLSPDKPLQRFVSEAANGKGWVRVEEFKPTLEILRDGLGNEAIINDEIARIEKLMEEK